ncbi:amidohydrolase family protein [Microvirga sp. BT689]|uniref:dihydroorotase n=1 Tax=Microvirga arvi TaxID=2778731 RepID=UPI00194E3E62|nr:amidohydrolase family protein [Microvirga arvi]MBM6581890.1 amidohydrolase family protein [Microvirga arvi]
MTPSSYDMILRGGDVLLPGGISSCDIAISGGRIAGILERNAEVSAGTVHDIRGQTVLPGIVDVHFHVRAPSYPERGTVGSETRAAAAGGVTTILEMPISKPCCNSVAVFDARRDHFEGEAQVNFGLYAAPGIASVDDLQAMARRGAVAFKVFTTAAPPRRDDEFAGLALPEEVDQYETLRRVAATGMLLVVHAESEPLMHHYMGAQQASGRTDAIAHEASRPDIVEAVAVAKILTMARKTGVRIHVAHVTSRAALDVIRAFKAIGTDVSAETCPHYLIFTNDDVARVGPDAKINPPIRSADDRAALWEGVADGTISIVTTDHAPFSRREKEAAKGNMLTAPPGSPGVEFLLPAMLDAASRGVLPLEKAIGLIAANGAKRFGLYPRKGEIAIGADADLAIVDLSAQTVVVPAALQTAARDCSGLYAGRRFAGAVTTTVVGGRVVYTGGQVIEGANAGRFVPGQRWEQS